MSVKSQYLLNISARHQMNSRYKITGLQDEKAHGLTESIPYISKMAIGNAGMECRNSRRVPPFSPLPSPER